MTEPGKSHTCRLNLWLDLKKHPLWGNRLLQCLKCWCTEPGDDGVRTINHSELICKCHCTPTTYHQCCTKVMKNDLNAQFYRCYTPASSNSLSLHIMYSTVGAYMWDSHAPTLQRFRHLLFVECHTWDLKIVFKHSVIMNHFVLCCQAGCEVSTVGVFPHYELV